jgi:thioredoxin reductase
MANTFKSYTQRNIGTSTTTVYTVPASTVAVVIGCNLSNLTGDQINADLTLRKSGGTDDVYIVRNLPIPNGSAYEFNAGNKIVLQTGDAIKVKSDTATSIDAILSVLEQT